MLVGYIWTADVDDQALYEQQYEAFVKAGVAAKNIYKDLGCPRRAEHPQLDVCLHSLRVEDTLVVWQLDGLGHDCASLLNVLQDLAQRQIGLKVLDEQASFIDPANISLDMIISLIESVTAFQDRAFRDAKEKGVAAARARGQAFGPKRKMTAAMLRQAIDLITNSDQSFTNIAKQFGFTRSGLYIYLNGDGSLKPLARLILAADTSVPFNESAEDCNSSSSTNR